MRLRSLLPAFLLGLAALAALAWLVMNRVPDSRSFTVALLLLVMACTGLLAPLLAWLQRRVPIGGATSGSRIALRQAFWLGLAVATLVFLQWRGLLNSTLVLGIGVLVLLLEVFAQSGRNQP
ncbi:MAG: hypothetical protein ABTQ73_11365 [Caldilineales bacterium]